ncbi:MAG TPA: leukotriene A4 hydrolase C-terminal domain-containing protein, partial [Catalimonadaceae bacterium]|nr:leukotriene A4 hydrolase C-terminal domain-containing protein [Catalimonadaceae bacterium]
NSSNSEVLFEWLMLSIQNNYQPASEALEEFLVHTGRRKFVVPLYKALLKTPNGKEIAMKIYAKARENYHSVTYQTVDGILNTP